MSRRAFLGLGSNIGDREGHLRGTIARLREAQGVNFRRASRVYETEPVGVADQPRFLNMVVEVEVEDEVKTRDLLRLVKRIEEEVGRTRRERWGPREIDIDVLLVEGERVEEEDFAVPHPRMWERGFVMVPLAELEPGLEGPGGETVERIAERLRKGQRIYADIHL